MEEPEKTVPQDVNLDKDTYFQLTTNKRNIFDQSFKRYQVDPKKCEQQKKGLQAINPYCSITVSSLRTTRQRGKEEKSEPILN
jgi:hypothetical protein